MAENQVVESNGVVTPCRNEGKKWLEKKGRQVEVHINHIHIRAMVSPLPVASNPPVGLRSREMT